MIDYDEGDKVCGENAQICPRLLVIKCMSESGASCTKLA